VPVQVGNMYTASLYAGLASLVEAKGAELEGKRLLLFSYGSGITAGMFTLVGRHVDGPCSLENLQQKVGGGSKLR
jgi:hydroxymethylglutaryl-CoA synthase